MGADLSKNLRFHALPQVFFVVTIIVREDSSHEIHYLIHGPAEYCDKSDTQPDKDRDVKN